VFELSVGTQDGGRRDGFEAVCTALNSRLDKRTEVTSGQAAAAAAAVADAVDDENNRPLFVMPSQAISCRRHSVFSLSVRP